MPIGIFITQGTTANCTQADRLIEGLDADYLLVNRDYDSNAMIKEARRQAMAIIILSKKSHSTKIL